MKQERPDSFKKLLYFHKPTISNPQTLLFHKWNGITKRCKVVCIHPDPSMHFMKPFFPGLSLSTSPGLHMPISNTRPRNKKIYSPGEQQMDSFEKAESINWLPNSMQDIY